jgi:hypothetical protein
MTILARSRAHIEPPFEVGPLLRLQSAARSPRRRPNQSRTPFFKGLAAQLGDPIQLRRDATAGEQAVDHQRQALPAEVVDHYQHPEATPIAQDVGGEVEAPALVWPLREVIGARVPP